LGHVGNKHLENLQAVICAKRLATVFCFYERGFTVMLLGEHHLEDSK